ncbi:MAG: DUF6531 domain-containing protein, partial [Chloroflexota bacterium]
LGPDATLAGGYDWGLAVVSSLFVQVPPPNASSNAPYLTSAALGDPVNTLTGNYSETTADLVIPGLGPSLDFTRTYNSDDPRLGPFGQNWTDSYNVRLDDPGTGAIDVVLVGPEGRRDYYRRTSGQTFAAPPGVYTTLTQNPNDGTYLATLPDQTTWTFDQDGRLTRITDRFGNHSDLTYDNQNARHLVSISDPAGRGLVTLAYDPTTGYLASVSDWTGRTIQYQYDSNDPQRRFVEVIDPTNAPTTIGYVGSSSLLATIEDADGHTAVTNAYDTKQRVTTQTDGLGKQTTFSYVTNGDGTQTTTVTYPTTSFDGTSPTIADTYDSLGRLSQRVSVPSATETDAEKFGYDANSDLTSVVDARGNPTTYCYDVDDTGAAITPPHGNLTRIIAPPATTGGTPLVTLYKYDARNNLLETVPPKGVGNGAGVTCSTNLSGNLTTTYATDQTFDAANELTSVKQSSTDPDIRAVLTPTTSYYYDDDANNPGWVTRIVSPLNNTTTLSYFDSGAEKGMLQSLTDPDQDKTTDTYDAVGRKLTMVDPNGNVAGGTPSAHTWSYAYDNDNRVLSVQAPSPATGGSPLTTTYSYDPVGNRTVVIDANGQVTKYAYDPRNDLSEVEQSPAAWTDPNATPNPKFATTYSYDNLGNLSRVTRDQGDSANERATDYTYDGLNRPRTETQYPNWPTTSPTVVTSYTYDGNGNRLTLKDPLGQTTSYGYDPLNRLTSISYSDGVTPNVAYSYDANGNRTAMTDGTGTTTYTYDEMDRPEGVASPAYAAVGYRYDLNSNRTKIIYPDATTVTYGFDGADRLQSLVDWASRTTSYQYFPDGNLQTVTNVDGTTASYSYDNAQRLTQVFNQNGTTALDQHSYTLDNLGNRTALSEYLDRLGAGPFTNNVTDGYDPLDRLTSVTQSIRQFEAMGQVGVAPTVGTSAGGTAEAVPSTTTFSGTVSQLSVYLDPSNTATSLIVGLYTNAGSGD